MNTTNIQSGRLNWFAVALGCIGMLAGCDQSSNAPSSATTTRPGAAGSSSKRSFPVTAMGAFYQGNAEVEMDRPREAATIYRKILDDGVRDPAVIANLAVTLLAQQDRDGAIQFAGEALRAAPENADIQLIQAATLWNQERYSEAVEAVRRAESNTPGHIRAVYTLINIAEVHPDLVGEDEILDAHTRLLSIAPRNLAALLSAARAFAAANRLNEAKGFFERCAALVAEPEASAFKQIATLADAVEKRDKTAALRAVTLFRNVVRQTERYRADVIELGPGVVKLPAIVPHPLYAVEGAPSEAIHAEIRFKENREYLSRGLFIDSVGVAMGTLNAERAPALYLYVPNRGGRLLTRKNGKFEDVTSSSGLADARGCAAAIFVDLNNDRVMDLVLSNPKGDQIFRGSNNGTFTDATALSGIQPGDGWLGATPYDYDNDGDLDLLRWSADRLNLMRNDGEGGLARIESRPGLPMDTADVQSIEPVDLDDDGDIDLFMLIGEGPYRCRVISNERLGSFRDVTDEMKSLPASFDAEPLIADTDQDGRLEIIDAAAGKCYELGTNFAIESRDIAAAGDGGWSGGAAADLDCDGALDLIFWRNDGTTSLSDIKIGPNERIIPVDLNGDGLVDLVTSHANAYLNETTGSGHWLSVGLQALITGDSKFNAFGLYSTIEIRAGELYQKRHVTGPTTHFGLGPYTHADVMRIVWPNGNYQDLEFRASDRLRLAADQMVIEEQSLKGSCPYLYSWNGERFEFVTDVLWRSALGMSIMSDVFGHHGTADDYFKIEGRQLAPRDGAYTLQFTEELWETAYLDYSRLFVVDHPAGTQIYVDERCTAPPYPTFEIHAVETVNPVAAAWDHHGQDCADALRVRDGRFVGGFAPSRYQGLVEDHDLTLDLGTFSNDARVRLFITGWLLPTDASVNVAVSQNPTIDARPPVIRVVANNPENVPLDMTIGFPSGKNKMMILDLTGAFTTDDHRIRISTNFAIYWDQAFVAIGDQPVETRVTELPVKTADIHGRGFSFEFPRVPGGPTIPEYSSLDPNRCWRDLIGDYTRFGDVTAMLQEQDSDYVIVGAGDEVTLKFDAGRAPALPEGWMRDFVIHTDGWLKDGDLNSATGKTVAPLPFHGMSSFPYPAGEWGPGPDSGDTRGLNTRHRDQSEFRSRLRRPSSTP